MFLPPPPCDFPLGPGFAGTQQGKKLLHDPATFTGSLDPTNRMKPFLGEKVLRDTKEYIDFLYVFGKFGCTGKYFSEWHCDKMYSTYVSRIMEAFLLVIYIRLYRRWAKRCGLSGTTDANSGGDEELLSGKSLVRSLRGTNLGHVRWPDGTRLMYYEIFRKLRDQRCNVRHESTPASAFDLRLCDMWRAAACPRLRGVYP
jgi:hypothetical protein